MAMRMNKISYILILNNIMSILFLAISKKNNNNGLTNINFDGVYVNK